jgi:voltage-gated potassium channel
MPVPTALELMSGSADRQEAASEDTPLLAAGRGRGASSPNTTATSTPTTSRANLFAFLEAKTPAGLKYETFIIVLILINVAAFIAGSLFVPKYNTEAWAARDGGICGNLCDSLWFGNFGDNALQFLGIGSTSVLEIFTVAVFTVEYLLRLCTADLEDTRYQGWTGRLRFIPTFFSMIDLASTVPFYIDSFILTHSDIEASSFLRMFRLLRMMRVEGRYDTALTMIDDVYRQQKAVLGTALFVGVTTWMTVSALYYTAERRNLDMIYCGAAPDYCNADTINVQDCIIDEWGITNCTAAGCPGTVENPEPCYNLFNSIPMASYYALLNLFGEFPVATQHSSAGQIVGTLTAVVAVAVFALPAGIIGNGFEDVIAARKAANGNANRAAGPIVEEGGMTLGFVANDRTRRGRVYNFLHGLTVPGAVSFDYFINALVVATAFTFMLDTVYGVSGRIHVVLDSLELISVTIFTVEYCLRLYSAGEDPKYNHAGGRLRYMTTFLSLVDLLSFLPFCLEVFWTGKVITARSDSSSTWSNLVKSLRLLRILRFERYTHAFTSFDDVISRNLDVLTVTAFSALLLWILFAAFLYITERDNPDDEVASNYSTVPNSMWVTLLNLAGESPLCQYSGAGKVATGILGLFATGCVKGADTIPLSYKTVDSLTCCYSFASAVSLEFQSVSWAPGSKRL